MVRLECIFQLFSLPNEVYKTYLVLDLYVFVNLIKHAFYVTDNFFINEFAILFQKYECQKNIYFRFYGFKNP